MSAKGDKPQVAEGPGFASRWSKLKQEARTDAPADARSEAELALEPTEADLPVADPNDDRSEAEILEELGLPNPDDLEPGDDFSGFMSKAVPTRLRNRALRKLWLTNPVLANLDELVDYGEDFTDAATVIENMQTAYQVGRGWADKVIKTPEPLIPRTEEAELDPDMEPDGPDGAEDAPGDGPDDGTGSIDQSDGDNLDGPTPDALSEADSTPDQTPDQTADQPLDPAPSMFRKRMRFRVAED